MEIDAVISEVKTELASIGAASKKNFEEINRNVNEMRGLVDDSEEKTDVLVTERLEAFAADISTRQAEADKAVQKRIDGIEVAMQRLPKLVGDVEGKEFEAAREFKTRLLARHGKLPLTGIKDEDVDVEELREYKSVFPHYMRVDREALTPDQMKTLIVGSDPEGGYQVVPAMSARVVRRLFESSPLRELAAGESISTGALKFATDLGEFSSGWVAEQTARPKTGTSQTGLREIPVHEQYARPSVSQTLLEDAAINLENWVADKVARKFARVENAAFVNGDGVNKPRGFLTYPAGTDISKQIEQVSMGHATQITTDGLLDVKYSMVEEFLARGTWLMNRLTVAEVMKLKDGDGQYIWRPGLQEGQPSLLLGLPLRMATDMPTIAANALAITLALWEEAYLVVDRLGITLLRDPYTNVPFVDMYTRKRVGGDVINFQAIKIGKIAV